MKVIPLEHLEEEFANLLEEKQLELIRYPAKREKYAISFRTDVEDGIHSFFFYRNDPMSTFYESAYFYLYMYLIGVGSTWKTYAVKAVMCLRKIPVDMRSTYLYYYHKTVADAYGVGKKAEIHRRQAIMWRGDISSVDWKDFIEEKKEDLSIYVALCVRILSHIVKDTQLWGEDDFYVWSRDQYELMEWLLKEAAEYCEGNDDCPSEWCACLYYFQGVYYKKTRRYVLAGKAFRHCLDLLSETEEIENAQMKTFIKETEIFILLTDGKNRVNVDEWIKCDDMSFLVLLANLPSLDSQVENLVDECFDVMAIGDEEESEDEDEEESEDEDEEENEDEDEEESEDEDIGENGLSFERIYELAEEGYPEARCCIGQCYKDGIVVRKNPRLAVEWFRLAADQGNSDAQYCLGDCFRLGQGVEQDYSESFKWYQLSTRQGNSVAQLYLGVLYTEGLGVEQNLELAVDWYRKSADQGNSDAQCCLGDCYRLGDGVDQDYSEAFKWYQLSAEQDNSDAQLRLGVLYAEGLGVEQNLVLAADWYRKSADQGNSDAQCCLGDCYCLGDGVEQDYSAAFKWYQLPAEQGNPEAQFNLGSMCEKGLGVERNLELAIDWYRKSAEQDFEEAVEALKKIDE